MRPGGLETAIILGSPLLAIRNGEIRLENGLGEWVQPCTGFVRRLKVDTKSFAVPLDDRTGAALVLDEFKSRYHPKSRCDRSNGNTTLGRAGRHSIAPGTV